jgi:hypothetical protein
MKTILVLAIIQSIIFGLLAYARVSPHSSSGDYNKSTSSTYNNYQHNATTNDIIENNVKNFTKKSFFVVVSAIMGFSFFLILRKIRPGSNMNPTATAFIFSPILGHLFLVDLIHKFIVL